MFALSKVVHLYARLGPRGPSKQPRKSAGEVHSLGV